MSWPQPDPETITRKEQLQMKFVEQREKASSVCKYKGCGLPIFFARSVSGRKIPLEWSVYDTGPGYTVQAGVNELQAYFIDGRHRGTERYRFHVCDGRREQEEPKPRTVIAPDPESTAKYQPVSHVVTDGEGHVLGIEVCTCPENHEGENKTCPLHRDSA